MVAPRRLCGCHALSVGSGCAGWCVERVVLDLHDVGPWRSKVGAFEHFCSFGTDLLLQPLQSLSRLQLSFSLLNAPFWGKCSLVGWKVEEAFDVVTIPEEELEILCRVLDVDEIVHEVAGGAWLDHCRSANVVQYLGESLLI